MEEKRGIVRFPDHRIVGEDERLLEGSLPHPSSSVSQIWRIRLRGRWELASVLNFLHVFQPVIESDLKLSAEDIEMALITPNDQLARLHITLLKGIPPVSKTLAGSDAWVTVLCKKLAMWWPWVAEGDFPLIVDHGVEIKRYKELDPTMRLVILKALCELRLQQDDMSRYINDKVKNGNEISTFRKERISGHENGTSYWYDGDSVIGHRLYREVVKVEVKGKLKGKGQSAQAIANFHWEMLATNLEEFQEISDKLSCSKNMAEVTVGNVVKINIIPVLEKAQKKREKALQRKQKESMLLKCDFSSHEYGNRRSCRDRRPVSYTFDEYDRCINEALQTPKKSKNESLEDDGGQPDENIHSKNDASLSNGARVDTEIPVCSQDDDKDVSYDDDDDLDDDDADDDDDDDADDDDDDDVGETDKEKGNPSRTSLKQNYVNTQGIAGLRRSRRNVSHGQYPRDLSATEKKRPRERSTPNPDYTVQIISDSEDGDMSEND